MFVAVIATIGFSFGMVLVKEEGQIIHDAEYAIIEAQNGEQWAKDDKEIEKKLAQIR